MIIALQALASAMIVGGLLLAFFGWDIVLVERGWTMVIAGSITAASGALLLGVAAAVAKLAKIETRLSRLQDDFGEAALAGAPKLSKELPLSALSGGVVGGMAAADAAETEPAAEAQPSLPLFEDDERHERDRVTTAEWPEDRDLASPVIPFPPRTTAAPMPPREEDEPDMKVPDFLLAERLRDADEELRAPDMHAAPDERAPDEREREAREHDEREKPVAETVPEREPEPQVEVAAEEVERESASEEEAAPVEARPATIIGTYNSGENKYVMFSDGSIEAQTPSGVFRFKSLDELKEFIAAGGEENTSSST